MVSARKNRLNSIDMLRGMVLVIMALDHVRDMMTHPQSSNYSAAIDFTSVSTLFFTRWLTNFCAPTFVLLAGVSAYMYGAARQRSTVEVSRYLAIRGVWLIFLEFTVIGFAWSFNLHTLPLLQVIWAIGWSMIALAALVWLPRSVTAGFGIVMITFHNGLDAVQPVLSEASPLWMLLHIPGTLVISGTPVALLIYPLVPWIGVMAVGYSIGSYFVGFNPDRPRTLLLAGAVLILFFLVLRVPNLYGDPISWAPQHSCTGTIISFLSVTKYPVSLQFLLATLGPAIMLLGCLELLRERSLHFLVTFGRVSLFYYILHLYLIHVMSVSIGLWQGFTLNEMAVLFLENPLKFGLSLSGVYIVWVITVLTMYPACKWFAEFKARRRDWWLSYI